MTERELVERHLDSAWRLAAAAVDDRDLAADVVCAAFAAALRADASADGFRERLTVATRLEAIAAGGRPVDRGPVVEVPADLTALVLAECGIGADGPVRNRRRQRVVAGAAAAVLVLGLAGVALLGDDGDPDDGIELTSPPGSGRIESPDPEDEHAVDAIGAMVLPPGFALPGPGAEFPVDKLGLRPQGIAGGAVVTAPAALPKLTTTVPGSSTTTEPSPDTTVADSAQIDIELGPGAAIAIGADCTGVVLGNVVIGCDPGTGGGTVIQIPGLPPITLP
jgi:hypothetical protein